MFADSHGSAARRQGNQSSYIFHRIVLWYCVGLNMKEELPWICLFLLYSPEIAHGCDYDSRAMANWRRPPGRSRNVWLNNVQKDADSILLSTLWRSEIARAGSRSGANVHSDYAMMTIMTMMIWRSSTLWNIAAEWQHSVFRDSLCRRPRPKFASIMHEQTSLTIWHNATQACLTLPEECRQRLLTDADENTSKDVIDDGDHGDFSLEYRNTQAERRIWH